MKNFLICILFTCSVTLQAFSQKTVIRYESASLSGELRPALVTEITGPSMKDVSKEWKSYLKKNKGKVEDDGDEYMVDNAIIKSISSDTLDIYSSLTESGKVIMIAMAINRNGNYISQGDPGAEAAEKFLYDFAIAFRKDMAEDEVSKAEKLVKSTEKEIEGLEKDNRNLEKRISKMKEDIADDERTIKKNIQSIDESKKLLEKQQAALRELERKLKNIE